MEAPKKTVVFFIDSLGGGGAERVVTSLCNRLSLYGKGKKTDNLIAPANAKGLAGTVIFEDFAPIYMNRFVRNHDWLRSKSYATKLENSSYPASQRHTHQF